MQVTGQNIQHKAAPTQQYSNSGYISYPNGTGAVVSQQTQVCQPYTQPVQSPQPAPHAVPPQYNPQYCAPQYAQYPQVQTAQQPVQNYQVPASASGVNIQIFNPSVTTPGAQPPTYNVNTPCYPSNYYTGQIGQQQGNTPTTTSETKTTKETVTKEEKKTEKKKIVQLTDEYIKNLENYLNSQDKEIRLSAANEVFARLDEDESRKDDKALTALINKMLQDPSDEIRLLALTALESRMVTGDDFTVGVLKNMQNSKSGYGQDAVDASKILLRMSGKEVEKEVPIKETKKKEETKESTKKA